MHQKLEILINDSKSKSNVSLKFYIKKYKPP